MPIILPLSTELSAEADALETGVAVAPGAALGVAPGVGEFSSASGVGSGRGGAFSVSSGSGVFCGVSCGRGVFCCAEAGRNRIPVSSFTESSVKPQRLQARSHCAKMPGELAPFCIRRVYTPFFSSMV